MNEPEQKNSVLKIVIFSFLVNAVAWIGPLLGGDPNSPGLGFLIWGTAPIVVSLLMRIVTKDWTDLGIKPRIKKNIVWYIVSLLAYPFAIAITLQVGSKISSTSCTGLELEPFIQAVLPAMVIYLLFALFEEVGWRGYLAPKMYSLGINIYLAHALVGLVWASWHLPYIHEFSFYTSEDLTTFIPRFYLGAFAFSIFYGEIRILTSSFWPAVLMHWVGNFVANPLVVGFVTFSVGKEYLGSIGVDGLFMIVFIGLLGVVINCWRSRVTDLQ